MAVIRGIQCVMFFFIIIRAFWDAEKLEVAVVFSSPWMNVKLVRILRWLKSI